MPAATSRLWLATLGLFTGACALAGYDFGDYERAPAAVAAAGTGAANDANATAITTTNAGAAGESSTGSGEGGAGGEGAGGAGGAGPEPTLTGTCEPRSCFALGLACGPAPSGDGCGQPLDCGPCFWWFQECVENRCEIPE